MEAVLGLNRAPKSSILDQIVQLPDLESATAEPEQSIPIATILSRTQFSDEDDLKEVFIRNVWPNIEPEYGKMREAAVKFCVETFESEGIKCRIESRIKKAESIRKSLRRREEKRIRMNKGGPFRTLNEILSTIHDLLGLRVILDYPDNCDHERAIRCIEGHFEVVGPPRVFEADRKIGEHWNALFGAYRTHNYRVRVRSDPDTHPLSIFSDVLFEIQVTTLPEDLYNKLAHDLLYKAPPGTRTREQEIVMDLSHGLSLCYGLTLMYMKDLLNPSDSSGQTSSTSAGASRSTQEVIGDGKAFFEGLRNNLKPEVLPPYPVTLDSEAPPADCMTPDALRRWLAKKLDSFLPTGNRIASAAEDHLHVGQDHLRVAEESRDIARQQLEWQMSEEEKRCHQAFHLTTGVDHPVDYTWYKDRIKDRVQGTCHWFLNQKSFTHWLGQESGTLLVSADPGCGKSVLAKYLVKHVLPPQSTSVCYFFFKDKDQCTISQALCALLHQLFSYQPSLIRHAIPVVGRIGTRLEATSADTLWDILTKAMEDPKACTTIMVIDALDECRASDLRILVNKLRDTMTNVRFLLTTRPYSRVIEAFDSCQHIRIPGEEESEAISREVDLVINEEVQELVKMKDLRWKVKEAFLRHLTKVKHRTYLWVHLVFDHLHSQDIENTGRGIRRVLACLPVTFYDAYEKILSQSGKRDTVRKALGIVLAAARPLTLKEMGLAMSVDINTQKAGDLDLESDHRFRTNLRSWCGLFVSIDQGKVYFLHQTAREFLLAEERSPSASTESWPLTPRWQHSITKRDAHKTLAEVCVSYISLFTADPPVWDPDSSTYFDSDDYDSEWESSEDDAEEEGNSPKSISGRTECSTIDNDHGLLQYATSYWCYHVRKACVTRKDAIFPAILKVYRRSCSSYKTGPDTFDIDQWHQGYDDIKCRPFNHTLSLASRFGHTSIVKHVLENAIRGDINLRHGRRKRTALMLASSKGHEGIVKLLLDTGQAKIHLQDVEGKTALMGAAFAGRDSIVRLLLQTGRAGINLQNLNGRSALMLAARKGNAEVVWLLLATRQANVKLRDKEGYTAFMLAATEGHQDILVLLRRASEGIEPIDRVSTVLRRLGSLAATGIHTGKLKLTAAIEEVCD